MNHGIQTLPREFLANLEALEQAYLSESDPIRQSGFRGGKARWRAERAPILTAVESDGDFLDVGCANGYLLECLAAWAREKGVRLNPFGLDHSRKLVEAARQRLPQHADQFWVGNAWGWIPPRKFQCVYTLSDCVPESYFAEYTRKLLAHFVSDHGRLIVGAYGSNSANRPARNTARDLEKSGFTIAGRTSAGTLPITTITWIDAEPAPPTTGRTRPGEPKVWGKTGRPGIRGGI